ncbi:uncharacterized protein LOC114744913 [Neltuma alba]|uniref:uncharacterized protein LOC114744913 n=1 Tax=Neltuma alba TaxID=207710 RepID=UPI0010A32B12|nr:uncharacterized protein LOC114744913 [Prosopis alba]
MFGKDRATGKDAQTCEDVLEELQDQIGLDNSMLEADPDADMDISHVNTSHPEDTSHVNNQTEHISSDASSGSKKRKRTRADRDDILLKGIETVARSFSEGLMEASDRLGMRLDRVEREKRLDGMKESLYGDLMKIEGLSHKECMAAYVKMISDEKTSFAQQSQAKVLHLQQQLTSLKKGNESILDYYNKALMISDSLAASGSPVPDSAFNAYLLAGLGTDYDSMFTVLTTLKAQFIPKDILSHLLTYEA